MNLRKKIKMMAAVLLETSDWVSKSNFLDPFSPYGLLS